MDDLPPLPIKNRNQNDFKQMVSLKYTFLENVENKTYQSI